MSNEFFEMLKAEMDELSKQIEMDEREDGYGDFSEYDQYTEVGFDVVGNSYSDADSGL
jgi:hypothetical protein